MEGFGALMDHQLGSNTKIIVSLCRDEHLQVSYSQPGSRAIHCLTFNGPGMHAKTTAGTASRAQPVSSVKELLLYCLSARKKK